MPKKSSESYNAIKFQSLANVIWSVADLLRGLYRPPQYGHVMLSLTVLHRFDAVLTPTKAEVLAKYESPKRKYSALIDRVLHVAAMNEDGVPLGFDNHIQLDFKKAKGDSDSIGRHLEDFIASFSENIRNIFER